jgi:hypothetical protein
MYVLLNLRLGYCLLHFSVQALEEAEAAEAEVCLAMHVIGILLNAQLNHWMLLFLQAFEAEAAEAALPQP